LPRSTVCHPVPPQMGHVSVGVVTSLNLLPGAAMRNPIETQICTDSPQSSRNLWLTVEILE
jgi:hypothetical protein